MCVILKRTAMTTENKLVSLYLMTVLKCLQVINNRKSRIYPIKTII